MDQLVETAHFDFANILAIDVFIEDDEVSFFVGIDGGGPGGVVKE